MKTLADTQDLGFARGRERSGVGFVYIRVGEMGNGKGCKKGLKTLIFPKFARRYQYQ